MHTVSTTRTIDAPVEDVWAAIDDFGNIYQFNPVVEHSESINDITAGEGAKRRCDFYGGGSIHEVVVESVPERRQVVDIFDNGPFPLTETIARFELEPVDEDHTEVAMTLSFVPKYGPAGWVLGKLMMERQFQRNIEGLLAGLDTHLQTGEVVGQDGDPQTGDVPTASAA